MANTIKITNNRAAAILAPLAVRDGVPGAFLTLTPGVNDVPLETWRSLTGDKGILRHHLKTRSDAPEFAALPESRRPFELEEGPITAGESLAGLTESDAGKLLAETLDPRVIEKWIAAEDREGIKTLCAARLEELKKPAPAAQAKR